MNVRLRYDMSWRAGVWFENRLQMNQYDIELEMVTNTSDPEFQIVALGRLKHFVYVELDSTVFINQADKDAIEKLVGAGIKLTTLPEEPIDQVVGVVLYKKFNAIMEDQIVIKTLNVKSDLGDNIWYLHNDQETVAMNLTSGWWNDPEPNHSNIKLSGKKNIVKLQRNPKWIDFDLDWTEVAATEQTSNTVVKFNKDENQ